MLGTHLIMLLLKLCRIAFGRLVLLEHSVKFSVSVVLWCHKVNILSGQKILFGLFSISIESYSEHTCTQIDVYKHA